MPRHSASLFAIVFLATISSTYTYETKNTHAAILNGADYITFLDKSKENNTNSQRCTGNCGNMQMIPIDFVQKISNYTVSDLLLNFVDDYEEESFLANRFGEEVERSPAISPKAANCIPELQTIQLVNSTDPSIIFLPSCTRIERCGGCCSHTLLSCEPKETETISFKVLKTQYTSGNRLKFVGKEVIHVDKHTKCECGCRTKAKDCNRFQEYRPLECRCLCINADEEKKCYKDNMTKLWDPDSCMCRCREITQCSTGYVFDGNNCKCMPIPLRRRNAEQVHDKKQKETRIGQLPSSTFYETLDYDP